MFRCGSKNGRQKYLFKKSLDYVHNSLTILDAHNQNWGGGGTNTSKYIIKQMSTLTINMTKMAEWNSSLHFP